MSTWQKAISIPKRNIFPEDIDIRYTAVYNADREIHSCVVLEEFSMAKSTRLGDGEFEVMQAIWDAKEPVAAGNILEKIKEKRTWGLSTLITVLGRLTEKGYLSVDKSTGISIYCPLVAEKDYKNRESRSFLEKVYGNSLSAFVSALYDGGSIKNEDLEELREFIEKTGKEK